MSSSGEKLNILISMNSFKGCLSALEGNNIVKNTLKDYNFNIHQVPLVDGGTGSLEAWSYILKKQVQYVNTQNPINKTIKAPIIIDNNKAYIEMAQASGIHLTNKKIDILKKTTYGTGLLIKYALQKGCTDIYLGLGGSATHDLGTGIMRALGVKFYNSNSQELHTARDMLHLHHINTSELSINAQRANFTLLCDVNNKLCGEYGAAKVFAPQKGAYSEQLVNECELLSTVFVNYYKKQGIEFGKNSGDGAAGGIPALLSTLLNVKIKSGADYVLELCKVPQKIANFDLVITGEGRFDEQSFYGKGPGAIVELASKHMIPTIILAGGYRNIKSSYKNVSLFSIVPYPCKLQSSFNNAANWLQDSALNAVKLFINGYTLGVRAK